MAEQVGSLPAAFDLILYAGDVFNMVVKVFNANGTPVDLTGAITKSQIRASSGSSVVLAEFAIQADGTNEFKLGLTSGITASLPANAVWDFQVTDAVDPAKVMTLAAGKVTVTGEVTR